MVCKYLIADPHVINRHLIVNCGKLVATGAIVPELHYGLYLRDWWIFSDEENSVYPIPLRLGLEVMLQLNKHPFIIRGQSSGIAESASKAMTSVYQSY
ncbi:hypothetical protein C1645_823915 [Glomus cerebriforme]|uniref:Uncharacterized protein n=1 Tax=Glomus cerebriforme TaxID=658196 RepID=A0A397SV55_9GLOM|nr:hypothetical protein C1645_823915 [Glomus cerebriforme]